MTRRRPSKATARALRIERRAAELHADGCFNDDEWRGWEKWWVDRQPRTPAEWSGWLAREIWSES